MQAHSIDNKSFLQALFGDLPDDESMAVCQFPGRPEDQEYWTVRNANDAPLASTAPLTNAYYCVASVQTQPQLSRRRDALKRLYVLPLDDIGTGMGAKLDPAEVPLEPTYAVETSPGCFQYGYLLDKPIRDMSVAKALISVTSKIADSGGAMVGKLMRLPIGINSKEKYGEPPPRTRLTVWEPGRVFSVEDILTAWDVDFDEFNAKCDQYDQTRPVDLVSSTNDEVLRFLEKTGMLLSDTPNALGFYEIVCPWHSLHTGGKTTAGYSPLGAGGTEYAHARQFKCLHDHCAERTGNSLVRWMFHERFSFNESEAVVHDALDPTIRFNSMTHFREAKAPFWWRDDKGKVHEFASEWLRRRDRQTVKSEIFWPKHGTTGVCRDLVDGEKRFNTFVSYPFAETSREDRLTPLLDHIQLLFGSEAENALGYMAYTVHKPELRIPFALLHVSREHGTGRGWFKMLMAKLLRNKAYYAPASFHNWAGTNFNEFLYRTLLVTFDEVYDRKLRFDVGERLKELITETEVEVNVKHGFKGRMAVYPNFMFFSNHIDALSMPDADRRFWCVLCEQPPVTPRHFRELYGALEDEETIRQMWNYLRRHLMTSVFDPTGRAPVTEWREDMQAASHDPEFDGPIRETVKQLKLLGVEAVWRSQLMNDCRAAGAENLHDLPNNSAEGRRFEAVIKDCGVYRHAGRLTRPDNGRKEYVYRLTTVQTKFLSQKAMEALTFAAPSSNLFSLR